MRILFVCMGNICRSPSAEGVFRALLAQRAPQLSVDLESAGTHDYHVGEPPDDRSIAAALRRGIDLSALRARTVRASDFDEFDLILTADETVDRRVRSQAPGSAKARIMRMTEPLPDFDRYPEVPDPYYGTSADYRDVYDLLDRSMNALLESLERE